MGNVVHVAADSFPDFDADLPDLGTDQSVDSQRDRYNCVNVTPIVGGCYTGHFGYHLHEGIAVKINTFDKVSSKRVLRLMQICHAFRQTTCASASSIARQLEG